MSAANTSLVVRRAADDEAPACRLLLPETFGPYYAPELWVAVDIETALIVGAGAVTWRATFDPPGFPFHIHVAAPLRRRGIGTALVDGLARDCAGSTACLHSWSGVADDDPAALFLARIGFAPSRRMLEYQADGPRFYAMVKSIHDRLLAAGKIPPGYRVVPLREAPPEEVAALVAANFRDAAAAALASLSRGFGGDDQDKSVVLLDDGEVRGALLYRWNGGDPVIDARVVAPEARGSAANLLMLEAATRRGVEAGAQRFRFSCAEDMRDTVALARRGGAILLASRTTFTRVLPS